MLKMELFAAIRFATKHWGIRHMKISFFKFCIFFSLLFLSNSSFCQIVNTATMENAVIYMDSLLNYNLLSCKVKDQLVPISRQTAVSRVEDSYWCMNNMGNDTIQQIEITQLYRKIFPDEYEMTHMSEYFYEPRNIICLEWCNRLQTNEQGEYIICSIFYRYCTTANKYDSSIIVQLYVKNESISGYEIQYFVD